VQWGACAGRIVLETGVDGRATVIVKFSGQASLEEFLLVCKLLSGIPYGRPVHWDGVGDQCICIICVNDDTECLYLMKVPIPVIICLILGKLWAKG